MVKVQSDVENPSCGVSDWPYRETGMRGFGPYSCGGLSAKRKSPSELY